ncbi:hypothetical protein B0H14DRAFT_2851860 [Mycena olivaceomarginata]|nr:hypothetical protein B0H14DRAFT_2851860 [Mycena olivaceomarginata]
MRFSGFTLLALPFALIGAAAAAAVRSENNLVESSLQGRQQIGEQHCLARGAECRPRDVCCDGLQCQGAGGPVFRCAQGTSSAR